MPGVTETFVLTDCDHGSMLRKLISILPISNCLIILGEFMIYCDLYVFNAVFYQM